MVRIAVVAVVVFLVDPLIRRVGCLQEKLIIPPYVTIHRSFALALIASLMFFLQDVVAFAMESTSINSYGYQLPYWILMSIVLTYQFTASCKLQYESVPPPLRALTLPLIWFQANALAPLILEVLAILMVHVCPETVAPGLEGWLGSKALLAWKGGFVVFNV